MIGRRLKRVTVPVPFIGAEATWEPSTAEADAAWVLLVVVVTRTSTAHLADDTGSDREALTSLHSLFDSTRTILRSHGLGAAENKGTGNLSLGVIAVRILNDVLRPFLSRWHPLLQEHESNCPPSTAASAWEREWGSPPGVLHQAFRAELHRVRQTMRQYIFVLGRAAGATEFAATAFTDSVRGAGTDAAHVYAQASPSAETSEVEPREHMTRWFDPVDLLRMARKLVGNDDTRDEHARGPQSADPVPTIDHSQETELWFDYVADMGDAFDPTMEVAWALGRASLTVRDGLEEIELPRGRLLILGGDEVYPDASDERYRKQLVSPYAHGYEPADGAAAPDVVAIPGNHDWYGSLQPWRKVFCLDDVPAGQEPAAKSFAGWNVAQQRSWWSVRLPHGWWIWGLDTYVDGSVNEEQRAYFDRARKKLQPGDQLVLVTPVPLWRLRESHPTWLRVIDDFVREYVDPAGATARLFLGGDFHVFASYHRRRAVNGKLEHHVTSGGGGAFLHPTHNLAPAVPQTPLDDEVGTDRGLFEDGTYWPDQHRSHELPSGTVWGRVRDRQSGSLALLLGLLHVLFAWLAGHGVRQTTLDGPSGGLWDVVREMWTGTRSLVTVLAALALLLAAGVGLANPNTKERAVVRFARRAGLVHGLAHVVVFFSVTAGVHWAGWHLAGDEWPRHWWLFLAAAVVGGALSVGLMVRYLAVVNRRYRVNDNEAFSVHRYGDFKHFVRAHLRRDGTMELRLVGIERTQRGWAEAIEGGQPLPPGSREGVDVRVGRIPWQAVVDHDIQPLPFAGEANRWVALSISEPGEGSAAQHELASVVFERLALTLLDAGCNLAYGGDHRAEGFTHRLAEHARRPVGYRVRRVRNYIPVSTEHRSPTGVPGVEVIDVRAGTAEHRKDEKAADLTEMRRRVTRETIARVVLGGKLWGSSGRAPGILEEAAISLDAGQPLFVIGGAGGAAGLLAHALRGQADHETVTRLANEPGYSGADAMLAHFGPDTDLHNGLDRQENERLLTTTDVNQVVHLVLTGLGRIVGPSDSGG